MVDTYTTIGGYAGIALVAGGFWYLQKRSAHAKQVKTKVGHTVSAKAAPIKQDVKQKVKAAEATLSSGAETAEKATKRKNAKKNKNTNKPAAPVAAALQATQVAQESDDEDSDEMSNKEFARQLSQAKMGLSVGARPQAAGRQKSVKQSRANVNGFTADAEDSESARSNQGGVADMLEAPAAGPSVLRISSPSNPQPQKEKKQTKAPEPVESKKARQNRKKREAEQEARADAEAQRKIMEENQRRTARLAEGRAAKDGSGFVAKAAAASVWKGPEGPNTASTNGHVQLLDTIEQPAAPQQKNVAQEYSSLPSEEEQMRQLQEEDEWQAVPSKKSKAKKNNQENVKPSEAAPVAAAPTSSYVSARDRKNVPKTHKTGTAQVEYNNENGEKEIATYDLTEEVWQV